MSAFEVPLTPVNQEFDIQLAGVSYKINLYWNNQTSGWVIDISSSDGTKLVSGIALVANTDLLGPYSYMNFGGQLIVQTDNDPNAAPTDMNLGSLSHLYFVTQ